MENFVGIFVSICAMGVVLFGLSLILSTLCMGRSTCMGLQVLMGSLRYSKEVDNKLNIVMGKIEAGMYHVIVGTHTISLYSKESVPTIEEIGWKRPELEIWVENKFYSYGNIHRVNGGEAPREIRSKRPSIKMIKQIYKLQQNNGVPAQKKKSKKNQKTIVLE